MVYGPYLSNLSHLEFFWLALDWLVKYDLPTFILLNCFQFDLEKIKSSSCKVSLEKLDSSNQLELQRILLEGTEQKKVLVKKLQNLIKTHFNSRFVVSSFIIYLDK